MHFLPFPLPPHNPTTFHWDYCSRFPSFHLLSAPWHQPVLHMVALSIVLTWKLDFALMYTPTYQNPSMISHYSIPHTPPPQLNRSGICSLLGAYFVTEHWPDVGQYFKRSSYINSFNLIRTLWSRYIPHYKEWRNIKKLSHGAVKLCA